MGKQTETTKNVSANTSLCNDDEIDIDHNLIINNIDGYCMFIK